MAKVNKEKRKLIRISIIFWIVVFLIYAAVFGPLIKDVRTWPNWVQIMTLVLVIILPLAGQWLIIYQDFVRNKQQQKKR